MLFQDGTEWPLSGEWGTQNSPGRLRKYEQNHDLFTGDHDEVFTNWAQSLTSDVELQQTLVYVMCGVTKVVPTVKADLLAGEPPKLTFGDDPKAEAALKGKEIIERNRFLARLHTNVKMNAVRGDGLFKLRRLEDGKVRIINQPPQFWFPEVSEDDCKEILAHNLAWKVTRGDKEFLRVERHTAGLIEQFAFLIKGDKLRAVDVKTFGVEERQETGLPVPLVFHVPNEELDDSTFGLSDYDGWESLIAELNDIFSQTGRVLKKHAAPGMYGPSISDESGKVTAGDAYIEVTKDDVIPGYLTWDAQQEAVQKHYDRVMEQIEIASEIAGPLLRSSKDGAAESGTALRRRLLRTIAKVNRARTAYDPVVKDVLFYAQVLEGVKNPVRPDIEWMDGLPTDPKEQAEIEQIRTGAQATTSRKSSIKRLDQVDDEAAQAELEAIQEEERASAPAITAPKVTLPTEGGEV